MKNTIKKATIVFVLLLSSILLPKQASAQQADVSFQVFYDQLSPYGEWVDYPNYGYVWIPNAGSDFVPYSTAGHWVMTDYGWTWVSDYEWGWAPFHYGRWNHDDYYGWLWIPDTQWGPSWVSWRRAEGYYGWAPMSAGVSISLSFGREYNNQNDHWVFVHDRDIEREDIYHYHINQADHDRIIVHSTVINTTYEDNHRHATYISGPARDDVQRVTGRRINSIAIHDNDKPGQGMRDGHLQIYRPQVNNNNENERRSAPSHITNIKYVKRPSERTPQTQPNKVIQQDNTRRTTQPNVVNPQNNTTQPLPQNSNTPVNTPRRAQQPNTVKPQNNTNRIKPTQAPNVNPINNQNKQPVRVNPQNNRVKPAQRSKVNPVNKTPYKQQQTIVKQQNTNTNRTQPAQQPKVNQVTSPRRVQQPNVVKPQNNAKVQPVQPPRVNPVTTPRRVQQPNVVKPQNKPKEQPKQAQPEENNRRAN